MKGKNLFKDYWQFILILLFGGFLFLSTIIAIGIYYPWAAALIVIAIVFWWWKTTKNAPLMPDDYDRLELKDKNETN